MPICKYMSLLVGWKMTAFFQKLYNGFIFVSVLFMLQLGNQQLVSLCLWFLMPCSRFLFVLYI